jgi:hypothetical protein
MKVVANIQIYLHACEAGPHRLLPRDAANWALAPRGPHLSASLLHGRETATHPTRYRGRYRSNPFPSSVATPLFVASQILVDGPSTRHHLEPSRRLHLNTAVKAAASPRCRRRAPDDKASRSASASSFLADTACGPSSL